MSTTDLVSSTYLGVSYMVLMYFTAQQRTRGIYVIGGLVVIYGIIALPIILGGWVLTIPLIPVCLLGLMAGWVNSDRNTRGPTTPA